MAIRIFKNLTTEIGKKDDNILKKRNYRTKNTYYKGGIKIDKYLIENNPTAIGVLYFFMLL